MGRCAEEQLAELAACAGPLRRVLAAIADRLIATKAHERLCYARLSDYARERPGLSARQLQELARVHRALSVFPALERALVANALPWSKVRLLARLAGDEDVDAWIRRAAQVSTRRLEQELRERSSRAETAEPEHDEPTVKVALRCTPAVRSKWSDVCELAERVAGERLRSAEVLELVVAEACSELRLGESCAEASAPQVASRSVRGEEPVCGGVRAAACSLSGLLSALAEDLDTADAFELDRRLGLAVRFEQSLDAAIAPLLRCVACSEYEWRGDFVPLERYARDALGMSASKARALLRLERGADLCPELREEWRSGRLSWVKAQCLLRLLRLDLPGEWRPIWVAWAERVTVRRLERDVERALLLRAGCERAWQRCKFEPERALDPIPPAEQQLCAHEVDVEATETLTWRVPRDVAVLFAAVRTRLSFEAMLDHVLATWRLRDPAARPPDPVIERDGYRCAVPGCSSRRSLHDHHIRFRSAGGSDAASNRVALCAFHHLRCLHAGWMRIRGHAPDGLVFELPLGVYRSGDMQLSPEEVETQRAA